MFNNKIIKIAHLNARSIVSNFNEFKHSLITNNIAILGVSETWLNSNITDNFVYINEGYCVVRFDRETRGGGVCRNILKNLTYHVIDYIPNTRESLEQVWINVKINKQTIGIRTIYRPPNSQFPSFLEVFEETLASVYMQCNNLICLGDLNINLLNMHSSNAMEFDTLLSGIGLKQIVNEPTRITQNAASLLDLIIVDNSVSFSNCAVKEISQISDHFAVICDIELEINKTEPILKTYRDFKNINLLNYENDLYKVPWYQIYDLADVDDKVRFLNVVA